MSTSLKRKASVDEEDNKPLKRLASHQDSEQEDSDDGLQEIVDVDFDFYNPDEIDFQALKKLLTQLFSSDSELINLSDFADIIIEENHVGTTVKVDDQKSDPYAILSIINLNQQKEKEGVKQLCTYLSNKCPKKNEKVHKAVNDILSLNLEDKHVGWVVSERFINMPVEIMAPMYNMLQEEVKNAVKQKEPYTFEWYMFISKTYKEVASNVDNEEEEEEMTSAKKKDKAVATNSTETFYFQSEDEIITKYAEYQFDFKFTNSEKEQSSDSRRAFSDFGIAPGRKLLLVHKSKFDDLVNEITKTCSSTAAV
ncbi:p21-C-terminal region-binding protein-domain-containing protein [Cokeromyces recurvatus]|uniref:p21-C-terminal region-binding protein-domain-containing protein n=1 Tax=Cokeromyces recurvatus TaxID=90255 RepID=UPI002220A743|nr:p21-C-terminal region-binding protein-domain-containing protein [Cokeromyces recurvatus]KAI7900802.1 p21-C-terminal region-binding protein-domain-containing protein [Cokeromyces recurvatus]